MPDPQDDDLFNARRRERRRGQARIPVPRIPVPRIPIPRIPIRRYPVVFGLSALLPIAMITAGIFFGTRGTDDSLGSGKESQGQVAVVSQVSLLATVTEPTPVPVVVASTPTPMPTPTSTPKPAPTLTPVPTPTPERTATPEPIEEVPVEEVPEPTPVLERIVPEVDFGEVLEEGFVELVLPDGSKVDVWCTHQKHPRTREATQFCAMYANESTEFMTTFRIPSYEKQKMFEKVEITEYDGGTAWLTVTFEPTVIDRSLTIGQITVSERPRQRTAGPSLYPTELRLRLANFDIRFEGAKEGIQYVLDRDLDVTGLTGNGDSTTVWYDQKTYEEAIAAFRNLVSQVENQFETESEAHKP